MKNRKAILIFLSAILVFACNLPAAGTPTSATPLETATVTFTPTVIVPTGTATVVGSTVPFASPNDGPLNCRSGPGTNFQVVVVLNPGQSAEVVGKNPEGTWWYVKNPSIVGSFCWISANFVTTTGDFSAVQVAAVPATPTNGPGSSSAGVVTNIEISVDPDTIHVGGCIGPVQPIKVFAKIRTSGAIKIKVHFKDEQSGNLSTQSLNFKKDDIQDVSDSFTPLLNAGKYKVSLVIEGLDVSSLHPFTTYKITC